MTPSKSIPPDDFAQNALLAAVPPHHTIENFLGGDTISCLFDYVRENQHAFRPSMIESAGEHELNLRSRRSQTLDSLGSVQHHFMERLKES